MSGVFSCRGSYMVCNSVTRRQKHVSTIDWHGYSHNRQSADVSLCQWRLCLFACAGQHSYPLWCQHSVGWGGSTDFCDGWKTVFCAHRIFIPMKKDIPSYLKQSHPFSSCSWYVRLLKLSAQFLKPSCESLRFEALFPREVRPSWIETSSDINSDTVSQNVWITSCQPCCVVYSWHS